MKVWTLVVDEERTVVTSVHRSDDDALEAFYVNYDPMGEFEESENRLQAIMDSCGLCVYIEEHEI